MMVGRRLALLSLLLRSCDGAIFLNRGVDVEAGHAVAVQGSTRLSYSGGHYNSLAC